MSDTEPRAFEVACKPGDEFEYMVFPSREQAVCYLDPVEGEPEQEVIPLYSQLLLDREVREAVDAERERAANITGDMVAALFGWWKGRYPIIGQWLDEVDAITAAIRARKSDPSRRQSVDNSNEKGT